MNARKQRGERSWTPEQRKKMSDRMKRLHANAKQAKDAASTLGKKQDGPDFLTAGQLVRLLGNVPEDTPVRFEASCVTSPEIKPDTQFDESGVLVVKSILIR